MKVDLINKLFDPWPIRYLWCCRARIYILVLADRMGKRCWWHVKQIIFVCKWNKKKRLTVSFYQQVWSIHLKYICGANNSLFNDPLKASVENTVGDKRLCIALREGFYNQGTNDFARLRCVLTNYILSVWAISNWLWNAIQLIIAIGHNYRTYDR